MTPEPCSLAVGGATYAAHVGGWQLPRVMANRTFGLDTISTGVLTAMRFLPRAGALHRDPASAASTAG